METKWTPGPWVLVETPKPNKQNSFWYEITADGYDPYADKDLWSLGEVFSTKADAHLIAAAPGLYAELDDVLQKIRKLGLDHWWLESALDADDIEAALAKARGQA